MQVFPCVQGISWLPFSLNQWKQETGTMTYFHWTWWFFYFSMILFYFVLFLFMTFSHYLPCHVTPTCWHPHLIGKLLSSSFLTSIALCVLCVGLQVVDKRVKSFLFFFFFFFTKSEHVELLRAHTQTMLCLPDTFSNLCHLHHKNTLKIQFFFFSIIDYANKIQF